jgi:hypothetical protein
MSRTPGNGKTVTPSGGGRVAAVTGATSAPSKKPSVDKPAAATSRTGKPKLSDKDRKKLMIGVASLVVALSVMSVYGYFNWFKKPKWIEPPLNDQPVALAKFVGTPSFDSLPFDRQSIWMDTISDRKKEIDEQYKAGKINREQYVNAKSIAWLGKRFKHIRKYYSYPEIHRKAYLDELINKETVDDAAEEKMDETEKLPPRDKDFIKLVVAKFPDEQRKAYDVFRKALKDREDEREKEAKRQRAATRPTERPAERQ